MNCREFVDVLQDHLDGNPLPSSEGLTAHLRECPACAELHAASRRLLRGLRLSTPPAPPAELAPAIAAAALRELRRRRLLRQSAFAVATAAAVLIVLGLRFAIRPGHTPTPVPEMTEGTPPSPAITAAGLRAKHTSPPLLSTVEEVGEAVASLTSRTADEAMGGTRLLLPTVSGSSLSKLDFPATDAPTRPLREAGKNLTASLDPVANSARRAVDLFLRDLPPVRGPDRGGL
jgi:hypothetical protein